MNGSDTDNSSHNEGPTVAPDDKDELIKSVVQVVSQYFSGPLPPPSVMRGYDEVRPGTSEDIVSMAKREQSHAHAMQERKLKDARRESIREWISKLAHGIFVTLIAYWMIEKGLGAALPWGLLAILILAIAFVIINIYAIKTKARIALADREGGERSNSAKEEQRERGASPDNP